jgi:hypothetical protein
MKTTSLLSCVIAGTFLVHVAPLRAANEAKDKTPWKITGQLEEACSCDAACPCWFGSKPTKMTCGGGQVLFIEKGNYGKVKLDGLAIASIGQSPEGQTMMESYGNWNFANYYIDEKANPEQRKALETIGRNVNARRLKENRDALRPDHSKDRWQRASDHYRAIRHIPRSLN